MSISKVTLQAKFPEVFDCFRMQAETPDAKYEEREKFWNDRGIKCFETWTVPYFAARDKDRKRPCLRLNHPEGICVACQNATCKFDKSCFFCGKEGHGAFQVHPGGKLKGQLKCSKHRNYVNQMETLKHEYHILESDLQKMFKLSPIKLGEPKDEESELAGVEASESAVESVNTQHSQSAKASPSSSTTNATSNMAAVVTPSTSIGAIPAITPDASKSSINGGISRTFSGEEGGGSGGGGLGKIPSLAKSKFEGLFVHSSDLDSSAAALKAWPPMSARTTDSADLPLFGANSLAAAMDSISFAEPLQIISPVATGSVVDVADTDFYDEHFTLRFKGDTVRLGEGGLVTFTGTIVSRKRQEYVAVRGWPKRVAAAPGLTSLTSAIPSSSSSSPSSSSLPSLGSGSLDPKTEIRTLRMLAKRSLYIANIWHRGLLTLSPSVFQPTFVKTDTECVVMESSALGNLDVLFESRLVLPQGLSLDDIKAMCVQLMDGLLDMHQAGIVHRNIHPKNVLVSQYDSTVLAGRVVFLNGFVLKWTNFTPLSVLNIIDPLGTYNMRDLWSAPEVSIDARKGSVQYQASSELWSLGLLYYFIASGGQQPFQTFDEAMEAYSNPEFRGRCLDRHEGQKKFPMLFDLIERLIRPVNLRVELVVLRCHPLFWTLERRKNMLLYFADAFLVRGSELINHFIVTFDKICLLYVFNDKGWVPSMRADLLQLIPVHLRTEDRSLSGSCLLHAIKASLQQPELLATKLLPKLSPGEAALEFVRQMTDYEFPRLLILLYELGGTHGKWSWDGDDVIHSWNKGITNASR